MNAAPTTANPTVRLVGALVVLIVAAVLLYYLYDYLFNITQIQKKASIVSGPIAIPSTGKITYPGDNQTDIKLDQYVFTGGEMSVSFWMYVTGVQRSTISKAHILHLGSQEEAGNPTLLVALGPANSNGLYIRVNDGTDASFSMSTYMNAGGDTDLSKSCNISNIEFGRWVNVTIVLNNNLCDVYMDGRLSRSCVLKGQYQVTSSKTDPLKFYVTKGTFGNTDTTWNGSLAGVTFYNYAVSPDIVYRIYMAGPSGASGDLWSAIKSFFVPAGNAVAPFLA